MLRYSDENVLNPNFSDEIIRGSRIIKPYCNLLNYLFYDEKEGQVTLYEGGLTAWLLAKVAIFTTNVDAEKKTLINRKCV